MNFNLIHNNELYRTNMSVSSMHRACITFFFFFFGSSKAESIELMQARSVKHILRCIII